MTSCSSKLFYIISTAPRGSQNDARRLEGRWWSVARKSQQEIGFLRALRFLLMRGRMFLRFAAGNEQDERKQDDRKDETGDKHIVQGAAKHAGEC